MSADRHMTEHRPTLRELADYLSAQAKREDLPAEVACRLAGAAVAAHMAQLPRERRSEGGEA